MSDSYRHVTKAILLVFKKPGLTDEEFKKHYLEIHMPMATELCQRHGVLEYNVVRPMNAHPISPWYSRREQKQFTTASDRGLIHDILGEHAVPVDCDAITTFIFPNPESLKASFADPDYVRKLAPDEEIFTDIHKSKIAIGNECTAFVKEGVD